MKTRYVQINQIILVGTSHIAEESIKNVAAVIEQFQPCIVGIELDKGRFYSLINEKEQTSSFSWQHIKTFGVKGYIFAIIASTISKKLAKIVGTKPGDDMLSAIKTARKNHLTIALLDQPINITLKRFSQTLTWKEKWNFFVDIFSGLFFPQSQIKKYGLTDFDLKKVPPEKVIITMLEFVKHRYPNIYKILIEERNIYMTKKIKQFQQKYPDKIIVAVIGAGHIEGISILLKQEIKKTNLQ
ncbi:MAG: TraB domain-containing protein [Candidatus Woesearchaeota archaeon]|jgi:pheromone shutdown-related protein TraB